MKLWYKKPAKKWIECLPLGNGHMGAMLDGGIKRESIYLNDVTLWSGYPNDQTNKSSGENLDKIRKLLFSGNNYEAEKLLESTSLGGYSEAYEPLGRVVVNYKLKGKAKDYQRSLCLTSATHLSNFNLKDNFVKKESFISFPDKLFYYEIKSTKPLSFEIFSDSPLKYKTFCEGNELYLCGNAPDISIPVYRRSPNPVVYGDKGMAYCLGARVVSNGVVSIKNNCTLSVANSTKTTIIFASKTGFNGFDKMPNTNIDNAINNVNEMLFRGEIDYEKAKSAHIADYGELYNKVKLKLSKEESEKPTNKLIKDVKKGKFDNFLAELFYNFGRYLLISSSREGGQPVNLQGLWNYDLRPAWSSNMTVNINTQMNYWLSGSCNLYECLSPYKVLLSELLQSGQKTAKINYNSRGFAVNHNVDIWRKSTPTGGNPVYAYFPTAGIWLANGLYSSYRYFWDGLKCDEFDDLYAVMEGACLFLNDFLTLHDGHYHICPSTSPEHQFVKDGKKLAVDYSSAIDVAMAKELIQNFNELCAKLKKSPKLQNELNEKNKLLYPIQFGKHGIAEWHTDLEFGEKGHRHFSPLYAVFPGELLTYHNKDEKALFEASKAFLDYRIDNGSGYTGWSAAWAIILYARFHDGEKSYKMLNTLLKNSIFINLFDKHPPNIFQIDGNLGAVKGINEMLLQEENGIVELLPALPNKFKNGSVNGLLTRNGYLIDMVWEDKTVVSLTVSGKEGLVIRDKSLSPTLPKGNFVIGD